MQKVMKGVHVIIPTRRTESHVAQALDLAQLYICVLSIKFSNRTQLADILVVASDFRPYDVIEVAVRSGQMV